MIPKIARRFGFSPSVPASLVDGWALPLSTADPLELAPRGGAASLLVDETGRIQPTGASWSLDWTLVAGARWIAAGQSGRITQRLVGSAVLETSVETPAGTVVQRVGAAVVDGKPVAILEVENAGGVAIAVGLVARPLIHGGRGYIGEVSVEAQRIEIDGRAALRYATPPATAKAISGAQGDLLQSMPAATVAASTASARCRSGGAQACAVWPLPHTATLRVVVELDGQTSPGAAVPALDEVNRGWLVHLEQGMQVDVDELPVSAGMRACARTLLTGWPSPIESASAVTALAELGFAADVVRCFAALERNDDDLGILMSIARWFQLASHVERHEHLDTILGVAARAAHGAAADHAHRSAISGPAWLTDAFDALSRGLRVIDQPDVAARIEGFVVDDSRLTARADELTTLTNRRDDRWSWGRDNLNSAARYCSAVRAIVVDDRGLDLRLLPELPFSWRGHTIDVLKAPVSGGSLSFGLRWHGARPALLWEIDIDEEADLKLSVPNLDPDFQTTDRSGEALLADPGWNRS